MRPAVHHKPSARWDLIAAILAVVAILVACVDIYRDEVRDEKKLNIQWFASWNPLYCVGGSDVLTMKIFGEETKDLYLTFFTIQNVGSVAILPEDYAAPLTVENTRGDTVYGIVKTFPIESHWKMTAPGRFEMRPVMLNPGEGFTLVIATELLGVCTSEDEPSDPWQWSARIANTKLTINGVLAGEERAPWLNVEVALSGYYVWAALILALCLFYLTAQAVRLFSWRLTRRWLVLSVIFTFSVANGETLASIAEHGTTTLIPAALPTLVFHTVGVFLLLMATAVRALRKSQAK